MSRKRYRESGVHDLSVNAGGVSAPAPFFHTRLPGGGELVDFYSKPDTTLLIVHDVPIASTLEDVIALARPFGHVRTASMLPHRADEAADAPWAATLGFYSHRDASAAQRALHGARMGDGTLRARMGVKRATPTAAAAAPPESLSAQACAVLLNTLLPLQWSNTVQMLHVAPRCAPQRAGVVPGGSVTTVLPGGLTGVWDDAERTFVPRACDMALRLPLIAGVSAGEGVGAAEAEAETSEAGAGAGAGAAPLGTKGWEDACGEWEGADAGGLPADDVPLPAHAVRIEEAKYADFMSRNPDACTADALASAEGVHNRACGLSVLPLITMARPPVARTNFSLIAPAPAAAGAGTGSRGGSSFPRPCVFLRQTITVHNADGSTILASAAGGCSCRHRTDKAAESLAIALSPVFGEDVGAGAGGACVVHGGRPFLAATGTAMIAPALITLDVSGEGGASSMAAAAAEADTMPLPLSQQVGGGGGGGESAHPTRKRRPRGHLTREWSVKEVVDEGLPIKFTAAEAFRRACDRLRILLPGNR